MEKEKTSLFNIKDISEKQVSDILTEVYASLEERGYNSINQIVGYLISGDPGYISSYNGARKKIQEIDRAKIVEIILEDFYKNNK
ncbi:MAG: IreB family regulatory phosphoprotein [Bacilli bacterium]|nr:IreB family regulatory phosphoprotein [Bacilli bacterium]